MPPKCFLSDRNCQITLDDGRPIDHHLRTQFLRTQGNKFPLAESGGALHEGEVFVPCGGWEVGGETDGIAAHTGIHVHGAWAGNWAAAGAGGGAEAQAGEWAAAEACPPSERWPDHLVGCPMQSSGFGVLMRKKNIGSS